MWCPFFVVPLEFEGHRFFFGLCYVKRQFALPG